MVMVERYAGAAGLVRSKSTILLEMPESLVTTSVLVVPSTNSVRARNAASAMAAVMATLLRVGVGSTAPMVKLLTTEP